MNINGIIALILLFSVLIIGVNSIVLFLTRDDRKDLKRRIYLEEFAEFVAKEVCTENFKEDADCFAELACRKLEKLGLVKKTESEWIKK